MSPEFRWSRILPKTGPRRLALVFFGLLLGVPVLAVCALIGVRLFGDLVDEIQSRRLMPQFEKLDFQAEYYSRQYGSKMAPRRPDQIDKASLERFVALYQQTKSDKLWELVLDDCSQLENVDPLAPLAKDGKLWSLSLNNCKRLTNLDALRESRSLKHLSLNYCEKLKNVDGLRNVLLWNVELNGCTALTSVKGLSQSNANKIWLSRCTSLESLDGLGGLTSLAGLDLSGCSRLTSIDALSGCHDLRELNVAWCGRLTNVNVVKGLPWLTTLNLSGCPQLTDLSFLKELKQLNWLSLSDTPQLTDLSAIPKSPFPSPARGEIGIESLNLQRCPRLVDIKALQQVQSLTEVDLTGCPLAAKDVTSLRASLPHAHIRFREANER